MPGVQYSAMDSMAQILSSVPEGQPTAALVRSALGEAVSKAHEEAQREQRKTKELFSILDGDASAPQSAPLAAIAYVPPDVVSALKEALPVLVRALETPSAEAGDAFQKLRRITLLTSTSQTMSAIFDEATLDRARDLGRPRVESPAVRYLERSVYPTGVRGPGRTGPVFLQEGSIVHFHQMDELLGRVSAHFGSEIGRDAWSDLFLLPHKDYRVATVDIRFQDQGLLRIFGLIRHGQTNVGTFSMAVPHVPSIGNPWTVKVETISIIHKRVGIGTQLLARLALFLHQRGVHAMRADARDEAGLFCAFNGFQLERRSYEEIVGKFVREMEIKRVDISKETVARLLDRDANLAELASVEAGGHRVGRDFLGQLFIEQYPKVFFELSADAPSWLRLLSNLQRTQGEKSGDGRPEKLAPLEWDALPPETRQLLYGGVLFVGGNVPHLMSSDREHAAHVIERLNNWATVISMMMDFPESMRKRMPAERKAELEEKRVAMQAVLDMVAADPASSLFSNFSDLMTPTTEEATGDPSVQRAFLIARTALEAAAKGLIRVPPRLEPVFRELRSRV
ncbi:MAG TPA: hypothetical protein VFX30_07840 [bacterium]|nr:hypothetical protein [bacterium]